VIGAPGDEPVVRFEILGPLRAWRGDRELDLGAAKQRAVLAVLLVNANKPLATNQIVDAVWGDDPPENGANVVQKYVAGLRRSLDPDSSPRSADQLLARSDAGYVLRVVPGSLDLDLFHLGVRQAQAARADGRVADAAAQLREALALWRAEPLAGVSGPAFEATRDRLTEIRAASLETWAELELQLRHHAELVPELLRLVGDYPLREQLRYLLILALYQTGRQAEALTAYRDAWRFFTEEYGVEPGERLQQLHRGILRSDPSLALPSETAAVDGKAPVPANGAAPEDGPSLLYPPWWTSAPISLPAAPGSAPVPARPSRWGWVLPVIGALIPFATCGTASWAVVAYAAARRRSWKLGLAALGYFALMFITCAFIEYSVPTGHPILETLGMICLGSAIIGGSVHGGLLGVDLAKPPATPPDMPAAWQLQQQVRREQALQLAAEHPALARQLAIGRPDVARSYDDGGLVDINAVHEYVFSRLPYVTRQQAQRIVAERESHGPFTSVDDLVSRRLLSATLVDALRDILIVIE
jgi:DNA-binding SARP family transcriptional activator